MIDAFNRLFDQTKPAFAQVRTFERARTLAMSSLVGLGRRTVSGMLCASAQQFTDWSAAYRLFERQRFDKDVLFAPARREVVGRLGQDEPLVVMMDDTLIRKRGRKVHGTGWKRDPLGPPFCSNFVWGQRFLQVSAALPDLSVTGQARGIPIDLTHAPSPAKPGKKAAKTVWDEYRLQQQTMKVSSAGAARLADLRKQLDQEDGGRRLIVSVDGGFTNRTVFRNLPDNTVAIGRIRKDAKLFLPPTEDNTPRRGRRRWYGAPLPTPEQIRQDDAFAWHTVQAFAAGKTHSFDVKTVAPLRWLGTGVTDARLVIVRPLAYRPRKGARLLYRNPVYLLCTDPDLPLERLLQSYLWRWEVELNFRDEKTVIGVGEAQVRSQAAVEAVPAFVVAAYAFLLLAGTSLNRGESDLPQPKWRTSTPPDRESTARMVGMFRAQLWGKAMGVNLRDFANRKASEMNPVLFEKSLPAAVCYAFR
ncbi:MAG: transposase [Desulfobulbus sp.]|nr:transposase [Desulfobulbus sp.]